MYAFVPLFYMFIYINFILYSFLYLKSSFIPCCIMFNITAIQTFGLVISL